MEIEENEINLISNSDPYRSLIQMNKILKEKNDQIRLLELKCDHQILLDKINILNNELNTQDEKICNLNIKIRKLEEENLTNFQKNNQNNNFSKISKIDQSVQTQNYEIINKSQIQEQNHTSQNNQNKFKNNENKFQYSNTKFETENIEKIIDSSKSDKHVRFEKEIEFNPIHHYDSSNDNIQTKNNEIKKIPDHYLNQIQIKFPDNIVIFKYKIELSEDQIDFFKELIKNQNELLICYIQNDSTQNLQTLENFDDKQQIQDKLKNNSRNFNEVNLNVEENTCEFKTHILNLLYVDYITKNFWGYEEEIEQQERLENGKEIILFSKDNEGKQNIESNRKFINSQFRLVQQNQKVENTQINIFLFRKIKIEFHPSIDGQINILLISKQKCDQISIEQLMSKITNKDKLKNLLVRYDNQKYFIIKIISDNLIQIKPLSKNQNIQKEISVNPSELSIQNITNNEVIEKMEKFNIEYNKEYEIEFRKLLLNDIIKFIEKNYKNQEQKSTDFASLTFNISENNKLNLYMKDQTIKDEETIKLDLITKKWQIKSNAKRLIICSDDDQSMFIKFINSHQYFKKVDLIKLSKIQDNIIFEINEKIIESYNNRNYNEDTQIQISLNSKNYNSIILEKVQSLINIQKYAFYSKKIQIMFAKNQFKLQKQAIIKDLFNNIVRSIWLKNLGNKPQQMLISDQIDEDADQEHIFVAMDIAHDNNGLNSILSLCYSISDKICQYDFIRILLSKSQQEFPTKSDIDEFLDRLFLEQNSSKRPWIHFIRDGLTQKESAQNSQFHNYTDESKIIQNYLENKFRNNYRFIYICYLKNDPTIVLNRNQNSINETGQSIDPNINQNQKKDSLHCILIKPKDIDNVNIYKVLVDTDKILEDKNLINKYAFLLQNLNFLSFNHCQGITHPMHIQKSDKDGRKLMHIQKFLKDLKLHQRKKLNLPVENVNELFDYQF